MLQMELKYLPRISNTIWRRMNSRLEPANFRILWELPPSNRMGQGDKVEESEAAQMISKHGHSLSSSQIFPSSSFSWGRGKDYAQGLLLAMLRIPWGARNQIWMSDVKPISFPAILSLYLLLTKAPLKISLRLDLLASQSKEFSCAHVTKHLV